MTALAIRFDNGITLEIRADHIGGDLEDMLLDYAADVLPPSMVERELGPRPQPAQQPKGRVGKPRKPCPICGEVGPALLLAGHLKMVHGETVVE